MSVTTTGTKSCIHCGTGFRPTAQRSDFCCAGCEFVHALIKESGLTQFYELQDGATFPVKSVVFQKRDYSWLQALLAGGRTDMDLDLQGVSCIGCVWLIERIFEKMPGALSIRVDSALGRMRLRWQDGFDALAFARELQSFGYLAGPPGTEKRGNRALVLRLGLCAALAMNAMLFTLPGYLGMSPSAEFAPLFSRIAFACSTLSFVIGGSYFFARSWRSLLRGVLHIDLPISLGLIAAYAGSIVAWFHGAADFVYFDFISVFTFLMLVGRWTQEAAVHANRNRLLDSEFTVAHPDHGERFTVVPGQIVPVKAQLVSEAAMFGMEWISGESETRTARTGQIVPGGAVNLTSEPIELEAAESWRQSMLAQLLDAAPRADRRARGMERFIRIYLLVILAVAGGSFAWWLAGGAGLLPSLQVLTSILVVSCPCAAGVALPLAGELANAAARRAGVLVRDNGLWARLPRVDTIAFDKTGTLTLETLALLNPDALKNLAPADGGVLLGMVEDSLHPVACCLREHLLAERIGRNAVALPAPVERIGEGVELAHSGHKYRLGRPGWAGTGDGDAVFTKDGELLAAFRFGDDLREDAAEECALLADRGHSLHILSGDRAGKVSAMAARLGIPDANARGGLSPDGKAMRLREIGPQRTLMIGDGANDSLAFNESLCTGTPAIDRGLLERKADFYFLGRGLRGIRALLDIAFRKRGAVRAVLGFAIAYNAGAVALSLAGMMNPLLAAVLMPLSGLATTAIAISAMRDPVRPKR
jgi:P-type Cu2+ transporter